MNEIQEISSENKPLRDERGRLLPGQTANPYGRPPGSVSLLGILKSKLEECPEGMDKKTYGHLIIDRMLSQAIKEGNEQMIRLIWAYIEGMPKQSIDHSGIEGTNIYVTPSKTYVFTSDPGESNVQGVLDTEGKNRIGDAATTV